VLVLDRFHQFLRVDFPSEILNIVPKAGVSAPVHRVVFESTRVRRQRQEKQEHRREERLKKQVFIIIVPPCCRKCSSLLVQARGREERG